MTFKEWQEKHGPNGGEYDIEMQRAGWNGAMAHSQSGDETAWLVELADELERLREMERNYSHQLGEMARLCDVVCSFVIDNPSKIHRAGVMPAAHEIMNYVDAVRPADATDVQWVTHIIGPDDVFPCAGEFDALRKANQHNKSFAKLMANDPSPNDPYCVALAESV